MLEVDKEYIKGDYGTGRGCDWHLRYCEQHFRGIKMSWTEEPQHQECDNENLAAFQCPCKFMGGMSVRGLQCSQLRDTSGTVEYSRKTTNWFTTYYRTYPDVQMQSMGKDPGPNEEDAGSESSFWNFIEIIILRKVSGSVGGLPTYSHKSELNYRWRCYLHEKIKQRRHGHQKKRGWVFCWTR